MFQLPESFNYKPEMLNEKFQELSLKPLAKTQSFTHGWVSPFGDSEVLVHSSNGRYLFAACKQEKILPVSVINDTLKEKIKSIYNL